MSISLSLAEKLLYSTLKISALNQGASTGTGTGFFMSFNEVDDGFMPVIITNKHVVEGADEISIKLHLKGADQRSSGTFITKRIPLQNTLYDHPDPNIDLCAILITDIVREAETSQQPILFAPITMDMLPEQDDWQYFDAIEEITMVGCPNGIMDNTNNFPIVRKGITATSPSVLYEGKPEFMIDMACFPGSSGSPVFLYNSQGYLDRRTNTYKMGMPRLKLLGVLYSGPYVTNTGQIILAKTASFRVSSMMHLGQVIRSSELKVLEQEMLNT